jgi:prolipoprotein diacylglyceryltransferase
MEFLVLIPSVLIFLYSLWRLVKDDYVFIRKGISLEQSFDIAFISLWISLFFSRLFDMAFHYQMDKNIFLQFFSLNNGGFSLIGAIVGGVIALFILGKYKKIPLGRVSDFFTLSLLFALPLGYLGSALFSERSQVLYTILNAVLFFLLLIFFMQFLKPKLMSRNLKEGTLSIIFLICFSLVTLLTNLLSSLRDLQNYFTNPVTITTIALLIFSIILYFKEAQPFTNHRRTVHR